MRDMDFYISDFTDKKGFDVDDFYGAYKDGADTVKLKEYNSIRW